MSTTSPLRRTISAASSKGVSGAMPLPIELPAQAREAAALMKALSHPDRLLLLCQLVQGERSVSALGEVTGIAQPSLSQQLGVLRGERLVATRREGKHVLYRIDSAPARAVLETLYGLYCAPGRPGADTAVRAGAPVRPSRTLNA